MKIEALSKSTITIAVQMQISIEVPVYIEQGEACARLKDFRNVITGLSINRKRLGMLLDVPVDFIRIHSYCDRVAHDTMIADPQREHRPAPDMRIHEEMKSW